MTPSDLAQKYSQCNSLKPPTHAEVTRDEYNNGFDTIDTDKDGFITRKEWGAESIALLDKDGDGKLSRTEYEAGFDMFDKAEILESGSAAECV